MNNKELKIKDLENKLLSEDIDYAKFYQLWEPLSKFLMDYEYLKGLNKLTQNEIANRAKTTQSAISRLVGMKGKPTYTLLNKVSDAVEGKLFITPLADMTVTLPYDLHSHANKLAEAQKISISELMLNQLREAFDKQYVIKHLSEFQKREIGSESNESFKSCNPSLGQIKTANSTESFPDNIVNNLNNSDECVLAG